MDTCLFCKIIAGEIPCSKVFEDDHVLAFRDIMPQAPQHILVIPKSHVSSIAEASDPGLVGQVFMAAAEIAKKQGLLESGYRLVTNHGEDGGQTVHHLHLHLLGGRQLQWPPG